MGSEGSWDEFRLRPAEVVTGEEAHDSVRGSGVRNAAGQQDELSWLDPWDSDPEAAWLTEGRGSWEDFQLPLFVGGVEKEVPQGEGLLPDEHWPPEERVDPAAAPRAYDAVARAQADPEKVEHIFDDRAHDHQWEATGLDLEGNWSLRRETIESNYDQIPDGGVYEVTKDFASYTVTVRGAVVDGRVRIGTAWVNLL
jgi:hypothetical protein